MTEHHEPRHDPERGRDLTPEEQKFYGAEPEDRVVEDGPDRPGDAAYEAGAPATEAAPASRHYRKPVDDDVDETARPADDVPASEPAGRGRESAAPLFPPEEAESLRDRWDGIQTEFVDEPRGAVEKADTLVGDVMQRLADGFSNERARLERDWDRGDSVSTEDLRVALKRYRSFFDRLLSV